MTFVLRSHLKVDGTTNDAELDDKFWQSKFGVETSFTKYLLRSQDAAETAQRRPNALLFFGTFVAVLGLAFFIVTLPGSPLGFLAEAASPPDFWSSSIQLFPRLLMLIFIQVLAGFFLRQYRTSMEDFRYFEAILRQREAQFISFILRKHTGDTKSLVAFAKEIMEDRPTGLLGRGQTTATLEAQRLANNEFATFYEKLADVIAQARSSVKATEKKIDKLNKET